MANITEVTDASFKTLPVIVLSIVGLAVMTRQTRSSMLEVIRQDYIRTARAKGFSFYKVIKRHALKNVMNPVVTAISGWFASLMAKPKDPYVLVHGCDNPIERVCTIITENDLKEVILAGHIYDGLAVTSVAIKILTEPAVWHKSMPY